MSFTAVLTCLAPAKAEIIFSQNLSGSSDVNSYVNSSAPNSGQWNDITGGSISSGALSFTRTSKGGGGSFTRSTDFSPAPQAVIYKFDINVMNAVAGTTAAAVWQVGSGFTPGTFAEDNSKVQSRFAINFLSGGAYTFRNPQDGVNYGGSGFFGTYTVTWVINNSGAPLQYTAPDRSIQTVANDHWDLWVWSYKVFDEGSATSPGQELTDLKFAFTAGSGTVTMDNFSVESLQVVPEPPMTGIIAAGFTGLVVLSGAAAKIRRRRLYRRRIAAFVRTWSTAP